MVLFISVTSELHNHEDETFHSYCPACILSNHPAITTDIVSHHVILYQQISETVVSPKIWHNSFFFPQIKPRAPPFN
jgi:hypothetical protein